MFNDVDHPNVTLSDGRRSKRRKRLDNISLRRSSTGTDCRFFRGGSYPWHVEPRLPVMHYCVRQVITMECIAPATGAK